MACSFGGTHELLPCGLLGNGWRLLEQTKIVGMRMDQITKDEVEKLQFPGSASNGNNALRTLAHPRQPSPPLNREP